MQFSPKSFIESLLSCLSRHVGHQETFILADCALIVTLKSQQTQIKTELSEKLPISCLPRW
jgi:hypothetical protein